MLLVTHRMPRTAAGCAEFVAAGAGMFECDVQFRGPALVVSHFLPFLGRRGWLEHDNGRFRWRKGVVQRDPTLVEALAMIPDDCGVLLDPKETGARGRARLVEALADQLPDRDRFRVSTSRTDDLAAFRAAGFGTWRTVTNTRELDAAARAGALPDVGVSVRHTVVDPAAVAALRGVTDLIVAWTVNDPARARQIRDLGVDGITTDRQDVMRAVNGV